MECASVSMGEFEEVEMASIEVDVVDDGGRTSHVEMTTDGEVIGTLRDDEAIFRSDLSGPDAERLEQVHRFARFCAHRETEYDVLPWDRNVFRMRGAERAIEALSTDEFAAQFGDLYPLVGTASHSREQLPVDLPDGADPDDVHSFAQDVYLDDGAIEAVSGVHVNYLDALNVRETVRNTDPFEDRDPAVRLELVPRRLGSPGECRAYVLDNVRCQIRDVYVTMGETPPEEYRVLGPGQYEVARTYADYDFYEAYHDRSAAVLGYRNGFEVAPARRVVRVLRSKVAGLFGR